jgi:hypothetical protein
VIDPTLEYGVYTLQYALNPYIFSYEWMQQSGMLGFDVRFPLYKPMIVDAQGASVEAVSGYNVSVHFLVPPK